MIGCEYASIFSGLGVLIELVDNREQLLSFLDSEISQALSYHFSNNNITVRHNEEYERVEGVENCCNPRTTRPALTLTRVLQLKD